MLPNIPLTFSAHVTLCCALAIVLIITAVSLFKGIHPLIILGAFFLGLAAGQPVWSHSTDGTIAVMVDLSPSTRGAIFRDPAALQRRINQLLGAHAYQVFEFSNHNEPLAKSLTLADLPCDQTVFNPPVADAILLFTDGQFDLPASAPPTYPVIDPMLNHPKDSAVTQLQFTGRQILATIKNSDDARTVNWTGATPVAPNLATPIDALQITANLNPGDLWPENDSLSIGPQPRNEKQKWWIGADAPPGWTALPQLPSNSTDYLAACVIALNNVPSDALSSAQQQSLVQYVRDLGGSLVIIGGDHAFAAGQYTGSVLEDLSPLSSSPPLPTQNWILLIDASGSMSGESWQKEIAAAQSLVPHLPPHDNITLASFAKALSIWPSMTVPSNIFPTGPTNLGPALEQIAEGAMAHSPTQLLLISDADTELPHPDQIAKSLSQKKIHLHLLAIGQGNALGALQEIARQTDGSVLEQLDPNRWTSTANQLLRSAMPDLFEHSTIALTPAPPNSVSRWNRTWIKPDANPLQKSDTTVMAARWQLGMGQVIALAYPAEAQIAVKDADQIAIASQDPRFKITIEQSAKLRISIDARQDQDFLNDQLFTAEIDSFKSRIPQTAPGQYVLNVPAPTVPHILTLRHDEKLLNRFSIAGHYPAEFDAIGNNLEKLNALATQTGGSVIPPGPAHPIQFKWPSTQTDLTPVFAFTGFVTIAAGLLREKKSRR